MSDSAFPQESSAVSACEKTTPGEDIPQFGAVDIVEAFTAMRHEWRGQTKESLALAEQIQATAAMLQSLESKLAARAAEGRSDANAEAKPLAMILVETDYQLSRAAAAIEQWEANRNLLRAADAKAVEHCVEAMSRPARWFAGPLLALIATQRSVQDSTANHPAIEGLNMVQARLRRTMYEQAIERIDVIGRPFDAETMHAIGSVESTTCPSGHVAEQLSPAYRRQGKVLRFAEVRTAK